MDALSVDLILVIGRTPFLALNLGFHKRDWSSCRDIFACHGLDHVWTSPHPDFETGQQKGVEVVVPMDRSTVHASTYFRLKPSFKT
jgi:hypothetical protein